MDPAKETIRRKRLIIGITGASGVIYGIRLLEVLSKIENVETHLIISDSGELCIAHETDWKVQSIKDLADFYYNFRDLEASVSSGSFRREGMVIIPCSMKTLSALAYSHNENLLIRAGDVTLKERKKLVLVPRETPLHLGHLRNLERAAEIGAIILPPSPAFYHRPKSIQDIIDHIVGRVLDILDIEHHLFPGWQGQ